MSFGGRQMAKGIADKLPPPDKLSSYKGGSDDGDGADSEDDADMGTEAHMEALGKALADGDWGAAAKAFKDAADACYE